MAFIKIFKSHGIFFKEHDSVNDSLQLNSVHLVGQTPLIIDSNQLINNLNAQYFNGHEHTDFVKTDGTSLFTSDLDLSYYKIKNLGDPVDANDAVNKQTLSKTIAKLNVKKPVNFATTSFEADINLNSYIGAIDGGTLVDGTRVLIKDQSNSAENGIYVYNSNDSKFERASDFDNSVQGQVAGGVLVIVTGGTKNVNTLWTLPGTDEKTIGSSPLIFAKVSGSSKASDISIEDAGDLINATNVEDALQELATNISTLSSQQTSLSITKIAGENLVAGDAVYINNDGKVYKALANSSNTAIVLGFAISDAAQNSSVSIQIGGEIGNLSFTAADIGKQAYLSASTSGQVVSYAPVANDEYKCVLGIITSATEIVFQRAPIIKIVTT